MTDIAPIEVLEHDPRDRFDVGVAVLVVVTTLVAACVGLLFVHASNQADVSGGEALSAALAASSASLEADQSVAEALTRLQLAREQAAHARSALEARVFGEPGDATGLEAERWLRMARQTERSLRRPLRDAGIAVDISAKGRDGPELDVNFPYTFRARVQEPVHVQLARRDAANGETAEWGKRTASYAAILTLLAVALYLFSFALTRQGRPLRGLFATVATTFLCLGLMFGPVRALSSPRPAPESAAADYARGAVALNAATQPSDYAEAEKYLARAIVARPDFAEAYRLRATARFLRGSPQYVGAASLTTPAALQRTLSDSRMARALGLRTSGSLGSQGFNMFLLGMRTNRRELLREALEITRTAVAARPDNALVRFNLGVSLLGVERVQEARTEYRRALELLLRRAESDHGFVVSGALTDLELVARYGPIGLTDDVRDIKELIVGSVARGTVGEPGSKARFQDVTATVAPGWAEVSIAGAEGLPDKAMLSAHWYHEEPQGLGWSSVEQLQFLASEPYRGEGGALSMTSEYVPWAKRCLPSGRYRVEVFHDGSLLGSASTRYDGHGVMAFVDEDHGVVGCRLATWNERRVDSPLVRSYVSKRARSGLHLLRLDRPPVPVATDDEAASRRVVERVLETLVRTPAGPMRYRGATSGSILGLTNFTHEYAYRGGRAYAAAGLDEDGSMVVAIVFGPAGAFEESDVDPVSILSSLARTDYVARPDAR